MRFRKVRCPTWWQVLSWGTMIYQTAVFYLAVIPEESSSVQSVLIALYSLFTVGLVVLGVLGTYIDPSDPTIFEERAAKESNISFDDTGYSKVCVICKTHVQEGSKHCCDCNSCIIGFDHHCKWLNNCIGVVNYTIFAWLLAMLELSATLQTAVCIWQCSNILQNLDLNSTLSSLVGYDAFLTMTVTSGLMALTIMVVNGHLIGFHIWLKVNHMTTYDVILKRRELKRNRTTRKAKSVVVPQVQLPLGLDLMPALSIKSSRTHTTSSHVTTTRRKEGWESDRLVTSDKITHTTEDESSEPKVVTPASQD